MYHAVDIFSDKLYVKKINKNIKVFLLILYVPNIVLLAIKEVVSVIGEILSGNSIMVLMVGFVVGWWAILTHSKWAMDTGQQGLIISALTIVAFSFIMSISLSIYRIWGILND